MMPNILPTRLIDKLFRIRKFQYSTYEIDHTQVKGTLRIANFPTNIFEVPDDMIPQQAKMSDVPTYVVSAQTIVAFTNSGEKKEPTATALTPELMKTARKMELTNYVGGQPFEPWNEYVIQGDPPVLIRMRTILARLEWFPDYTNGFGDPSLWAYQNTTQNVSVTNTGESGLT